MDQIREHLIDVKPDGSFRLDQAYFDYCGGLTMTSPKFDALFGGPPRAPESELTQRELDLAASVQVVTESVILRIADHLHAETGMKQLCLAGGVALNCVANGRLLRESPFEKIWVQPAAGDAGGALGAAMFVWHQLLESSRTPIQPDGQQGSLLGPAIDRESLPAELQAQGAVFETVAEEATLNERVAKLLAAGNVVGRVQGRMEFGPRALGARSILGDPRNPDMQRVMNQKIKFRESFRPFAPMVMAEHAADYFDISPETESPYMLIVAPVKESQRRPPADAAAGLEQASQARSTLPAITHVDYSARVQTVDPTRSPELHRLLQAFAAETGCHVLINTSFNIRGEPIVCTAQDAYRCFMATDMDVLVIENIIMLKTDQPSESVDEKTAYLARFGND